MIKKFFSENYKKPLFWVVVALVVVCVIVAVCFLIYPIEKKAGNLENDNTSQTTSASEAIYGEETPLEPTVSDETPSDKKTPSEPTPSNKTPSHFEIPSEPIVTIPDEREIKKLYIESFEGAKPEEKSIYVNIYKTFSDGSIGVYIDNFGSIHKGEKIDTVIAGYKYKERQNYDKFYIYKNKSLVGFVEAYNTGIITKNIVDEFFEERQKFNKDINFNGLSKTVARKMINDYVDGYLQDFCEVMFNYKGSLSDSSILVWIGETGVMYPAVMVDDYIANEYLYTYSSGYGWTVYKNGQFKSIKNAYDTGLITKATLDELFEKFPVLNRKSSIQNPKDVLDGLDIRDVVIYKDLIRGQLYNADKNHNIYSSLENKDIVIKNCGTLSDGNILLKCDLNKPINNPIEVEEKIGDYTYKYKMGYEVRIAVKKDEAVRGGTHDYYPIKYAYENGYISDKVLDEIFQKLPSIK